LQARTRAEDSDAPLVQLDRSLTHEIRLVKYYERAFIRWSTNIIYVAYYSLSATEVLIARGTLEGTIPVKFRPRITTQDTIIRI
jgi:hypothetical protein